MNQKFWPIVFFSCLVQCQDSSSASRNVPTSTATTSLVPFPSIVYPPEEQDLNPHFSFQDTVELSWTSFGQNNDTAGSLTVICWNNSDPTNSHPIIRTNVTEHLPPGQLFFDVPLAAYKNVTPCEITVQSTYDGSTGSIVSGLFIVDNSTENRAPVTWSNTNKAPSEAYEVYLFGTHSGSQRIVAQVLTPGIWLGTLLMAFVL